jgi:ribonuclease BN (tRNA processing enzyme)
VEYAAGTVRLHLPPFNLTIPSELASIALSAFLQGRETPLPVYGPQGTKEHVDIIFSQIFGYIPRLPSARGKKFDLPVTEVGPQTVIEDDIKITCAKVIHGPILALGYRVDTNDGSIGFSGDTAPCDDLVTHDSAIPLQQEVKKLS